MVNRIQAPGFSQARRDATSQILQQIAQSQDIQAQPMRNRLMDLQAQQRQQELELAPQRFELEKSRESREQSIFETDEDKRKAALFIQAAPVLNAEAKRLRAIQSEDIRRAEVEKLKPLLRELGVDEGLDFDDVSDGAFDRAISVTEPLIRFSDIQQKGGTEFERLLGQLDPEERRRAMTNRLGLTPKAVGSASQTIAERGTAEQIAATEATISSGKESGKLMAQSEIKPELEAAIVEAKDRAKSKGEAAAEYAGMKAALPGLQTTVDKLKELAPIATYTFAGQAFDAAAKQLGFGSTEGNVARERFINMIRNQVLPLLKPTFGAQFTKAEGDKLEAAMADPNSSPEAKIAVLEDFLAIKIRVMESKQIESQLIDEIFERGTPDDTEDELSIDALVNQYAD